MKITDLQLRLGINQIRTQLHGCLKIIAQHLQPSASKKYTFHCNLFFSDTHIWIQKRLEHFCMKPVFKKLLNNLCKDCLFSEFGRWMWKIDGCSMGDPILVVLSNILCVKLEFDVVKALN